MLLQQRLKEYRIILASASPRRAELMHGAGFHFEQCAKFSVDESFSESMPVAEVPEYLARKKSFGYKDELSSQDILLTADTIVVVDDRILGKPENSEEAVRMLSLLSGREHLVYTGVCIRTMHKTKSFTCVSKVGFRTLSLEEIDFYVNTCQPMDKAGAYGIQEWIGYVGIHHIEGSYFNVMGLPVQQIYVELEQLIP